MYSPRVGRFFAVDPEAKKYSFQSPYAFATNNPVRLVDVNGLGVDKKEDDYYYNSTTGGTKVVKTNDKKDNLYVDGKKMATLTKGQLGEGYTNLWFVKKPIHITNTYEIGDNFNFVVSSSLSSGPYYSMSSTTRVMGGNVAVGEYLEKNKKSFKDLRDFERKISNPLGAIGSFALSLATEIKTIKTLTFSNPIGITIATAQMQESLRADKYEKIYDNLSDVTDKCFKKRNSLYLRVTEKDNSYSAPWGPGGRDEDIDFKFEDLNE